MVVGRGANRPRLDSPFPDGTQAAGLYVQRLNGDASAAAPDRNELSLAWSHNNGPYCSGSSSVHFNDCLISRMSVRGGKVREDSTGGAAS